MKYNTWREAHSELKHGDTVWAVRLQDATGTEKPVFCILLAHMTKAELDRDPNPPRYYPPLAPRL